MPKDWSACSASSRLRSAWFSTSFAAARRPASAKATAGHPNAAAAFGSHARLPRVGPALGTPAVRRSFSGSASGAKAAAFKRRILGNSEWLLPLPLYSRSRGIAN